MLLLLELLLELELLLDELDELELELLLELLDFELALDELLELLLLELLLLESSQQHGIHLVKDTLFHLHGKFLDLQPLDTW